MHVSSSVHSNYTSLMTFTNRLVLEVPSPNNAQVLGSIKFSLAGSYVEGNTASTTHCTYRAWLSTKAFIGNKTIMKKAQSSSFLQKKKKTSLIALIKTVVSKIKIHLRGLWSPFSFPSSKTSQKKFQNPGKGVDGTDIPIESKEKSQENLKIFQEKWKLKPARCGSVHL